MKSTLAWLVLAAPAAAQIGGTGALGAFAPTQDVTLDTSSGGTFDYTSIAIAAGVTVRLIGPNPAILRSQGNVDIQGTIDADGTIVEPGAGGWPGGFGGYPSGTPGMGPGGGTGGVQILFQGGGAGGNASHATEGMYPGGAPLYGDSFPFDLTGGSGGGGPAWSYLFANGSSTSGGGAVAILADGDVSVDGVVSARGGDQSAGLRTTIYGGLGSGGAILVRAIGNVRVTGTVTATGGRFVGMWLPAGLARAAGGDGFVRIDAYRSPPDVSAGAIDGDALIAALPLLRDLAPPAIGQLWQPRCATVPGDPLAWFVATATLPSPVVLPFGELFLDYRPGGGFVFAGTLDTPTSGIDPLAGVDFPVPDAPVLQGLTFYSQMFDGLAPRAGFARLSNLLTSAVQ
ncbi:MAG: hypothetical protein AAF628_27115 [Planctomycetota bacterium]